MVELARPGSRVTSTRATAVVAADESQARDMWERQHDGGGVTRVLLFAGLGYHVSATDASQFTVVQGTLAQSLDEARPAADALLQLLAKHRCSRVCRAWSRTRARKAGSTARRSSPP